MSSMSDVATMHPAKEKHQPFLWSQALYLIARLLSMLYLGNQGWCLYERVLNTTKYFCLNFNLKLIYYMNFYA